MRLQRTLRIGAAVIACAALPVAGCSTTEFGTGPNGGAGQLTVDVTAAGVPGAAFEVMVIGDGITNPVVASAGDLLYVSDPKPLIMGTALTQRAMLKLCAK